MMFLALSGLLVGALFSTRFTVLALLPATAGASAIAAAIWWSGTVAELTVIDLALFLSCFQVGYICGAMVQRITFARQNIHWPVGSVRAHRQVNGL